MLKYILCTQYNSAKASSPPFTRTREPEKIGKFHQKNVAVSKIYVLLIKMVLLITLINNDGKGQYQGQLQFIWD